MNLGHMMAGQMGKLLVCHLGDKWGQWTESLWEWRVYSSVNRLVPQTVNQKDNYMMVDCLSKMAKLSVPTLKRWKV
jgi:hypothetical protein